jgi:hypothetical protein
MCADLEFGLARRTDGGIGPVRHPAGAHALAEGPHADQQLLHLGRRELVVDAGRSRFWQAVSAAWYWESLTPSCCAPGNLSPPDACGSGKFGRPFERMHWAKASREEPDDSPGSGEPPGPVDDGLLQAGTSRAREAVAVMTAAARTADGHPRRDRHMARGLWFIMSSGKSEFGFTPAVLRSAG